MHHSAVSTNYAWLPHNIDPSIPTPRKYKDMPVQPLGDKQNEYERLIQGCVDHYGPKGELCHQHEVDRVDMTFRQPQSMFNYTQMGFTKIRAPEAVFNLIKQFWDANRNKSAIENWPTG